MMRRALLLGLLLAWVQPLHAQLPQAQELTEAAIDSALALYNRTGTVHMSGDSRIAPGSEIVGDLAATEGTLQLDGTVRGNLLLINGNLHLGNGARIEGAVTVIGGTIDGFERAVITGGVQLYRGSFMYRIENGVMVHTERKPENEIAAGRDFKFGRTDLIVNARRGYNRVEGMPIYAGPRVTIGRLNPTILEGLLAYRTASGLRLDDDQLGYSIRAEQSFGGRRALRLGGRFFSEVQQIELGGLSDRETSLSAFVLHADYRDHFERVGWMAYARLAPQHSLWGITVEFANEADAPLRARHPWSLIDNAEPWRLQPLAASGELQTVTLRADYDSRNSEDDPANGWWLSGEIEKAVGGQLRYERGLIDELATSRFSDATIDIRRYARLGPGSRLAVRVSGTGSVDGKALPVQRQHALGGEGSLPGFALHRFDCGARESLAEINSTEYTEFYGCDRAVLVQLEYQTDISFLRRFASSRLDALGLLQRVRLAGFFDAGRAWNEPDARGIRGRGSNGFAADGGFGVRLGPVGLYWAVPLSGPGQTMNFFVRIGPRI